MFKRGCVVISNCGRDKGYSMAVLDVFPNDGSNSRLVVADGRQRRIEHPKQKNPRHVTPTGFTVNESSMATNRELRRALSVADEAAGCHKREGIACPKRTLSN